MGTSRWSVSWARVKAGGRSVVQSPHLPEHSPVSAGVVGRRGRLDSAVPLIPERCRGRLTTRSEFIDAHTRRRWPLVMGHGRHNKIT
ncbi:unnamed protein product [Arctia plantaginis]|uniref:Uncharacterized protein n=1 Tax=Arctia plantaginis TaxID=874455 RepID=A0A8S1ASD0_ARCPL|nr:unnamed protein product [Arctia plantaginis]